MLNLLRVNKYRYLFSMIIALMIAFAVNYYFGETEFYLIPVTTLYVMQTSIGNSFYQGAQKFLYVIVIVCAAALFVYSGYLFYQMAHDVLIGSVIGIASNIILLPRRPDIEFREKILPVIKTFNTYFSTIIDELLQQESNQSNNAEMESALLKLPDWVYQRGFSLFLQKGYRFFLIKIEQISDVLFSMHHLVRYQYDKELIAKIRPPLLQYVENVNQFFSSIVTVLELKTLSDEPSDLEKEMAELQKQFFSIVPSSLELLDMRRDYVYLAAFIYDLMDLRKLLLKLGEALR